MVSTAKSPLPTCPPLLCLQQQGIDLDLHCLELLAWDLWPSGPRAREGYTHLGAETPRYITRLSWHPFSGLGALVALVVRVKSAKKNGQLVHLYYPGTQKLVQPQNQSQHCRKSSALGKSNKVSEGLKQHTDAR